MPKQVLWLFTGLCGIYILFYLFLPFCTRKLIFYRHILSYSISLLLVIMALLPKFVQAQEVIRDTELENGLRVFLQPLLQAATLLGQPIRVSIINSEKINAAMLPSGQMLIFSGLITKTDSPLELTGVMAHELGHHLNHDLLRLDQERNRVLNGGVLGAALGLGIALGTGNSEALISGALAGRQLGERRALAFSRGMEVAADRRAVALMQRADLSLQGLVDIAQRLLEENPDPQFAEAEYMRTHPLSANRLAFYQSKVQDSAHQKLPAGWQAVFERMKAKLIAFTLDIEVARKRYPPTRTDLPARMAQAIIAMREGAFPRAKMIMQELLNQFPQDYFLYDLQGDILRHAGEPKAAIAAYTRAIEGLPWAALTRYQRAQLLLRQNASEADLLAQQDLRQALRFEPDVPAYWQALAETHTRTGNAPAADMALAEAAWASRVRQRAQQYARRVQQQVLEDDPLWLQADDLLRALGE